MKTVFFDYTFTIVIPDSLFLPNNTNVKVLSLEFMRIDFYDGPNLVTTGVEAFTCEPPSCFLTGGMDGCMKFSGTIMVPPGKYYAIVYTDVIVKDFPSPIVVQFPSPHPNIIQGYTLTVYPEPATGCVLGIGNVDNNLEFTTVHPNPFNGITSIVFNSKSTIFADFKIYNTLGKAIETRVVSIVNGENKINFDGSSLSAGVYILTIGKGNDWITEKLIVQH